ncbi:hypothetical protein B296_00048667 [Ensete ventricosum]|uniref:Uncharacterized protein n=1 Tax=Ensete ventricosum TaxID=4639 RepID=A0A426X8I5_ENSVE|nr:hypothetical protein B296_00048667 [Ensete ventricosum]
MVYMSLLSSAFHVFLDSCGFLGALIGLVPRIQDRVMEELHSQGRTIEEITENLKRAPLPASAIAAIKSAYALGYA